MTRRMLLALLSAAAAPARAEKKKKKGGKPAPGPLGLLSGTVFRPDGLSLPGARVVAIDAQDPKARFEAVTDTRGEFGIRAPAPEDLLATRTYRVRAEAKGLCSAERTVEVAAGQRSNVNLILEAAN